MSGIRSEETRNLEVIRRGFEAFAAGDIGTLKSIFALNAHYRHTPAGVLGGDYRGQQTILDFLAQVGRETEGTLRAPPTSMAASGDRVFVLYRQTGTRRGKTLDSTDVLVFTLANGAVTEAVIFMGDYPAMAAFWS